MTKFLAAAVQMLTSSDKKANCEEAEGWLRKARAEGAKLVALPEVFNWRGAVEEQKNFAEPIPGPTSDLMARLARELEIHLLAGSILETVPGDHKVFNTSLLFDPRGNLLAQYRKIHLFDVDLAGGVAILESDTRRSGRDIVAVETELGSVGLSVCYDLRFPELYRRLVDGGARMIFVPSAFTALTGEAHWEPLLRSRAIENQVYIIAPDQAGRNPKSMPTYGHSMIVDPWGKILARATDETGVILAEIDLDYLARVRRELPALSHRRLF